MRTLLVLTLLSMTACRYNITLKSEAPGARVDGLKSGPAGLPTEIPLRWVPFVKRKVTVSAPNYRTVEVDLGARTIRAADFSIFNFLTPWRPSSEDLDIVLVPEHGASGTWTAEDLEQDRFEQLR